MPRSCQPTERIFGGDNVERLTGHAYPSADRKPAFRIPTDRWVRIAATMNGSWRWKIIPGSTDLVALPRGGQTSNIGIGFPEAWSGNQTNASERDGAVDRFVYP